MALLGSVTVALLLQGGPGVAEETVIEADVAYAQLVQGQDRDALRKLETTIEDNSDDPATLLNLGIALARTGRFEEARQRFEAVLSSDKRFELETASGEWVDSRVLAKRAIALLDRGEFASYFALSMR